MARKTFVWNMIGGFCNSVTSFLLLLFVTRILGSNEGGIFSFAFATAQLMLTIGKFGVRAYQATDVQTKISYTDYLVFRIITGLLMILFSGIYVLWNGYSGQKLYIILCVCLIKLADAVEDVFHGELQRIGKLDVAGKLLTIRNITTILIFLICLLFTKQLFNTCLITAIISIVFCLVINVYYTQKYSRIRCVPCKHSIVQLFWDCLPLFVGAFLSLYIYNSPKNAIDHYLSYEYQTYYSILFMPAFVINLFSEFVFKPLLTNLALLWENVKVETFLKLVFRLLGLVLGLTIIAMLGAYFVGVPILSFVYGVELYPYQGDLLLLMCGGGFGAAVYLLNNVLTSMRKQNAILIGYALFAIFIGNISPIFVKKFYIRGAAISYLLSIAGLFTFFFIVLIVNSLLKMKNRMVDE